MKRSTRDHANGVEVVSIGRDRRGGHLRGRDCGIRGGRTVLQMDDGETTAGRAQSSISDPYGNKGFMQLSK